MRVTQAEKGRAFAALHQGPGLFVIPNPWDAGSARMLASLGFKALATSSAAAAGALGRRDYGLRREEALANARAIVEATDLPVSADLEDGFGREPEAVVKTVQLAIEIGLAGCSIEDAPGDGKPHPLSLAAERVAAAVETARKAPFPFVLTARAENFCRSCPDLADTIARLQAYEKAGAPVLFAPGLPDLAAIGSVVASVTRPLNVVGSMQGGALRLSQLEEAGVKRVSLGASLYRAALTGLRDAAVEIRDRGTFAFAGRSITSAAVDQIMGA